MKLQHRSTVATVDSDGGRLASLVIDGVEVLVTEGAKPTRWGSFPMVPWCGRLRNGELHHDGAVFQFPLTSPPHANHGLCHTRPWEVQSTSGDEGSSTTTTEVALSIDLDEPWPFGGHVVQRFELGDGALPDEGRFTVTVEVHADREPMPAMAGWHPWFRRDLGVGGPAELVLTGGRIFAVADDGLPTGELVDIPPGPWDACFTGFDADPVIRWPGALELTVSSTFDRWVIFTEPTHALCVEPESGAPNDLNRQPVIVEPGQPLVGSMTFTWRRS